MPTSTVVRSVPKPSITALKAKPDRESALRYCLKAINHRGSGRPGPQDAADTLLYLSGYSASMACRDLTGDNGLYLTKWPIKNVNSLQIEICRIKRSNGYPDTPGGYFVEICGY